MRRSLNLAGRSSVLPVQPLRRRPAGVLVAGMLVALVGAGGLGGCGKKNTAANGPGGASEASARPVINDNDFVGLYKARRFREARESAEAAIPKAKDRDREVAQLTAGCAAHAMGDLEGAKRHLTPLTGSKDPAISGRAEACLGQIAQAQGQQAYAATLFKNAAGKLDGDDAARAGVRAGNALSSIGQHGQAIQQYKAAAAEAESAGVKQTAAAMSEPGPFAVQAGVFASQANAEARARQLQTSAVRYGYGTPRVVPAIANGRKTFSVKIGVFPTRQAAADARGKLGLTQTVVVAAD
ncbi:MAG: SPOR domain-containing protein [Phycisphaerales bacterium]|nr:SPOR domain-containing protein [Phycisphaerales bacterium]